MAAKRYCVQEHGWTTKHRKKSVLVVHERNEAKTVALYSETSSLSKTSQIHRDLCEVVISADILPNKVRNKQFSNFVESIQTEAFQQSLYYDRTV